MHPLIDTPEPNPNKGVCAKICQNFNSKFDYKYSELLLSSEKEDQIQLSRFVVIEIFSFFSSKTDFRFEFLVKTFVYAGNFRLMQ